MTFKERKYRAGDVRYRPIGQIGKCSGKCVKRVLELREGKNIDHLGERRRRHHQE